MKKSLYKAVAGQLAAVAVTACVFAGAAQAAVYNGNWDPAYGSPFVNPNGINLGWRGITQIYVPDSCVLVGTGVVNNVADCGGLAAVQSALVQLYDVDALGQPTLNTLNFNPASLTISNLEYLSGNLAGLQSSQSSFVFDNVVENVEFSVQFDFIFNVCGQGCGVPLNAGAAAASDAPNDTTDGPKLFWQDDHGGSGVNSITPTITFQRVLPEPAGLALALSALALAGWSRRGARRDDVRRALRSA